MDFLKRFFGGASAETLAEAKQAIADAEARAIAEANTDNTPEPEAGEPVAPAAETPSQEVSLADVLSAVQALSVRIEAVEAKTTPLLGVSDARPEDEAELDANTEAEQSAGYFWAQEAVEGNFILPFQAESYAGAYDLLASICAEAQANGQGDLVALQATDGSTQTILEAFAAAIAPKAPEAREGEEEAKGAVTLFPTATAHGLCTPQAISNKLRGASVVATKNTTEAQGEFRKMADEEIISIAKRRARKK